MNLIDQLDMRCARARKELKFEFTIQCADCEAISMYMQAEGKILQALEDQESALSRIKGE